MPKQSTLLALALTLLGLVFFGRNAAANSATVAITPSDDGTISQQRPTENFDATRLTILRSYSFSDGQSCLTDRINSLIKIDLSSVPFSIEKAQLDLRLGPGNEANFGLLTNEGLLATSDDDSWDESTVTFDTRPAISGMVGTTNSHTETRQSFVDHGDSSTNDFATWLASQQVMNGGNNLATIMIDYEIPFQCTTGLAISHLLIFCDKEDANPSCDAPTLTVADAAGTIPGAPTAVAIASESVADTASLPLTLAASAILAICTLRWSSRRA